MSGIHKKATHRRGRRVAMYTAICGAGALALATVGIGASTFHTTGKKTASMAADDIDWFSNDRLLEDCDGTNQLPTSDGGTGYGGYLDKCTYEESSNKDYWKWQDMDVDGNLTVVNNCGVAPSAAPTTGSQNGDITETHHWSKTTTTSWSIGGGGSGGQKDGIFGVDIGAGFGMETSTEIARDLTITAPAGYKNAFMAGQKMHHSEGRIRVNYSTPVGPTDDNKHYIWYINGVNIDTPYTNDNVKDLSGGKQSPGTLIAETSQDLVSCDSGGKLISENEPPYATTDGPNPPNSNSTKTVERAETVPTK